MNKKLKLLCVRNKFTGVHKRVDVNQADSLVAHSGYEYISKTTYKSFLNSREIKKAL